MKNEDKPINPVLTQSPSLQNDTSLGLTKREYFSVLAMQGLISSCDWNFTTFNKDLIEATSKNAIDLADELLKQLENK